MLTSYDWGAGYSRRPTSTGLTFQCTPWKGILQMNAPLPWLPWDHVKRAPHRFQPSARPALVWRFRAGIFDLGRGGLRWRLLCNRFRNRIVDDGRFPMRRIGWHGGLRSRFTDRTRGRRWTPCMRRVRGLLYLRCRRCPQRDHLRPIMIERPGEQRGGDRHQRAVSQAEPLRNESFHGAVNEQRA